MTLQGLIIFAFGSALSGFFLAIGWALATFTLSHLHAVHAIRWRHVGYGVAIGLVVALHVWPAVLLGLGVWWIWNHCRQHPGELVRTP